VSVELITFGCRLNAYESEAIRMRAAGLDDTVIVNTCAVTAEAVRQSRQAIRKVRRERPGTRIVVTGCAAQTEPQTYAAMREVDFVLGNAEKLAATSYADFGLATAERVRVNDIMSVRETASQMLDSFQGRTHVPRVRAFLQVQNGCDHRCTFCVIPFARGNSRSVPVGAVIAEARRLTRAGVAEIVLTGVDLTSYGGDLPGHPTLGTLVRKLLKLVPELRRLRLSSLDSIEVDTELSRAIAEEARLMPHFHLSAQSGDDLILKRMKRRHTRRDTIAFCAKVRSLRPNAAFSADLIAGFPTETEAMFQQTLNLVDEAGLTSLHVFPFSPRAGTPAARMPQVNPAVTGERAARLRAKGAAANASRLSAMIGSEQLLLVEQPGMGRGECFTPVLFDEGAVAPGSFVRARIREHCDGKLKAVLSP